MSTDSPQIREDEGGGGRFAAISSLTDMDSNAIHPATPTPIQQQEEEVDAEYNNKRNRENEISDISPSSRIKLDIPSTDNITTGTTDTEDTVSNHVFIVEFVGKSKTEELINDRATIRHLINKSPLGPKSSGGIRFQPSANKIILHINNPEHIEELLNLNKLTDEEGDWPIICHRAQVNQGLSCIGVIKGIHPSIKAERVKATLLREGGKIIEVTRIVNQRGNTFCIKIKFQGMKKPPTVKYDGYDKFVHPFIPPSNTLLCRKCGKGSHRAIECNTKILKCPICSNNHDRVGCPKLSQSHILMSYFSVMGRSGPAHDAPFPQFTLSEPLSCACAFLLLIGT